jgi:hypothetical protein
MAEQQPELVLLPNGQPMRCLLCANTLFESQT